MLKRIMIVGGTVLAIGFAVSTAMAVDNEPKKAGKYQASGTNGYNECTVPSETTAGALPLPACPAADSTAALCNFNDKGKAKLAAKAKDDVYLKLKASGIENCETVVLQATATIQANTNSCTTSARCSTVTLTNFPIPGATCTVADGKCQIQSSVNGAAPGTIVLGENTSIRIGSVALMAGTTTVVTAGVLVP